MKTLADPRFGNVRIMSWHSRFVLTVASAALTLVSGLVVAAVIARGIGGYKATFIFWILLLAVALAGLFISWREKRRSWRALERAARCAHRYVDTGISADGFYEMKCSLCGYQTYDIARIPPRRTSAQNYEAGICNG